VSALRSLCGRLTWMSRVAKQMAPFVAPMWAAVAPAEKNGAKWLQKVIMDFISDARDGDGRYLVRRFPLKAYGRNPCIRTMVVEACWSGIVVAISLAVKMKSKSAVIERIAMELAYDGARSSKVLDMKFQHIAGASNCWADALRLQLGAAFPRELEKIPGRVCPVRDFGFLDA
ncbi:hypothetical protein FOL47_001364, partial [Perkinsus chesapeaki]